MAQERCHDLDRAGRQAGARLRRARAQVAALTRARRRLSRRGARAGDLLRPCSGAGPLPAAARQPAVPGQAGRQPAAFLQVGALALDRETKVASVAAGAAERQAVLTPSEARLLALLLERPAHIWSCRDLARLALGYDVVEAEAAEIIRPHISRLRQKLEPDPLQPCLIRTVRGRGYLLSP